MHRSLDDPGLVKNMDRSDMLSQIMDFPDHLSFSLRTVLEEVHEASSACLCGVGGSAISGDILVDLVSLYSNRFVSVVRGEELPGWVNDDTLIIIVSYSGNTIEALRLFEKALAKGRRMAVITSGGKLMQRGQEEGVEVIAVPPGFQPRAALGHLLGSAAHLLERAGIAPLTGWLMQAVPSIKSFQNELRMECPQDRNLAKQTALRLCESLPVIYAPTGLRSAAKRWHTQINENSKTLAFMGEVPECNHNHIVGWLEDRLESRYRPVFLRGVQDDSFVARIMDITIQLLEERGREPVVLRFPGHSHSEVLMKAIVLGDFVSYYLALLKGVDPTPVESIIRLKERMK